MSFLRRGRRRGPAGGAPRTADEWCIAALKHEEAGELELAVECFEKGGELQHAAELATSIGRDDVAARLYLLLGEPLAAAHLLRDMGCLTEAAEAFLEADYALDAAGCYVEAGERVKAAEIYERERRNEKAAELYLETGDAARAASLYKKVGQFTQAAAAYERAGDVRRAAEAYLASDRLPEASRAFAQSGDPLRAATILESRIADLTRERYRSHREGEQLLALAPTAAGYFLEAGEAQRAVSVLRRAELFSRAAEIAWKHEDYRRAAELYRLDGDLERAARCFARAGDELTAARLEAEHHLKRGHEEKAAECFVRGDEPLHAAEIYERLGRSERAARLYEKSGRSDKAAEHFLAAGCFGEAAPLLAAQGRYLEAAKAAAEANRERDMIQYLQQVPRSDPRFTEAAVALARAFTRRGWAVLAVNKLEPLLEGVAVDESNLELFEGLAEALEASGELEKADDVCRRMVAHSFDYRDIGIRQARLAEKIAEEKAREQTISRTLVDQPACPTGVEGSERYALEELIGKGGMGEVYRAHDRLLDRRVAYKMLSGRWVDRPGARDMLLHEARAAAGLNHPNIVTIYDLGAHDDRAFIVMELVDGRSYRDVARAKAKARLSLEELLHFLVSVCQGLDHAHRRGIVHRDLKPANILLTNDDRVKILDFGLARPAGDEANEASSGGTPRYMPPEQALGRPTDGRSDIYSLGASVFELASGRAVFGDGDVIEHHIKTPAPRLKSVLPDAPDALDTVVARCLEKRPESRYASAHALLESARALGLI